MTIDMGKCAYLGCFDLCKNKNDLVAIECANGLSIGKNTFKHVIISNRYYAKVKSNNKKILDKLLLAFCKSKNTGVIQQYKMRNASKKAPNNQRHWWIDFEEYKELQSTGEKYPPAIPTYIRNLESMTYEDAIEELQPIRNIVDRIVPLGKKRSEALAMIESPENPANAVSQPESTASSTVDTAETLNQKLSNSGLTKEAQTNILNWYKLGFLEKGSELRKKHGPLYNCFENFSNAVKSDNQYDIELKFKEIKELYDVILSKNSDIVKKLNNLCGIPNKQEIPEKRGMFDTFKNFLKKRHQKSKETGGTQKRTQSKQSSKPRRRLISFKNLSSKS